MPRRFRPARTCRARCWSIPLEVDEVADKWKEKGQRKRKWVSPAEAARMLNEPDLCKLISAFGGNPRKFAA